MRWFAIPWPWRKRTPTQRPDLHIILYTRQDCHLCEEAHALLLRYQKRYGFILEAQNVDASEELRRAHGDWVPVVSINSQVRFRGHVNAVLLERMLVR